MSGIGLAFELLDEVIVSHRAVSLGAHPGHDHLPGANLLGAVAAALYRKLTPADAWLLFHSGKVRFGDGLPAAPGNRPAWPLPRCWYREPGTRPWDEDGRLAAARIFNLLQAPETLCGNLAPLEPGYVTGAGELLRPRTLRRTKTAVVAADGATLARPFAHRSLAAGQRFLAEIAWDEDVPPPLIRHLLDFFDAEPRLLLGRSRSAQYGGVACRPQPRPAAPRSGPLGTEFSLWLLSDLAACDGNGYPTLAPAAEDLGLPPATSVPERSFVRRYDYSPYNGFHRLHGRERQVIAQGSVLTYRLAQPLSAAAAERLIARAAAGLGAYRESGLGRCVAAPALLQGLHPEFAAPDSFDAEETAVAAPVPPNHPLARWLIDATDGRTQHTGLRRWAEQALWELERLEQNARRLNGLRENQPASPGKSQWGRVAEAARRAGRAQSADPVGQTGLLATLNLPQGPEDDDWERITADRDGHPLTFRDWLERKIAERPHDTARAIVLLAELAQRRLNGKI